MKLELPFRKQTSVGWLAVSHYGPFEPFGIKLPTLAAQDDARATRVFFLHMVAAYTLIVLLAMHVGAALQHYLIRKDGVLRVHVPKSEQAERRRIEVKS